MIMMLYSLLFALAVSATSAKRQVLMVSFDGFRWDYLNHYETPNFHWLANTGSYAPLGVRPAFATKTFPDHYTIVTGLYEESHGIVSNRMYDPVFNESFVTGNTETKWWDGGEPIWITARLAGLKTAAFFWPGSDVELKGMYANHYVMYDKSISFEERVDTIVQWLVENRVDLAVSYFHEPDEAGHKYGVFTPQLETAVKKADDTLGRLLTKLRDYELIDKIDLLVVSDHGMANITHDKEHLIVLSQYLDPWDSYVERIPQEGALAHIQPKEGLEDAVYQKLKHAHPNMTVYKKQDIPERFHYKNHRRIMPILAVADEGYYISKENRTWDRLRAGEHGYDNELKSMKPIFFARGPDFRKNYQIKSFDTVSIYPLICHLLSIKPAPNNGTLDQISDMLTNDGASVPIANTGYSYLPIVIQFLNKLSSWL